MGLAPYGKPVYLDKMREILDVYPDGGFTLNLKYFRHHNENVSYSWNNCAPQVGVLYTPELESLLGRLSRLKTTIAMSPVRFRPGTKRRFSRS